MRALATFGTGRHADLLKIALPSFCAYADRHGYDLYVADRIGTARPPSWYKVEMLHNILSKGYQAALWIDADVVIVDGRDDWPIGDQCWQSLVKHHTGDGEVPNHGIWYVKREMIPWLEKIWELDKFRYHGWWEQAAAMELLGYQPDARPCHRVIASELYDHTSFLDPGWNVHVWDSHKTDHPRFQHATMQPNPEFIMRQWAQEADSWINHS
jgi:hypothetical protein